MGAVSVSCVDCVGDTGASFSGDLRLESSVSVTFLLSQEAVLPSVSPTVLVRLTALDPIVFPNDFALLRNQDVLLSDSDCSGVVVVA